MIKLIQRELKLIRLSIASYSRISAGRNLTFERELLAKSVKYYPLVGLLIGIILATTYWLLQFILPSALALILVMSLELLLTGAMHHDGFADVCDAFGASSDKTKILAIMKDSHIGVYGVLGLIMIVLLHFAALNSIQIAIIPIVIVAGNSFSRIASPIFIATHQYVTPNETSKSKAMLSKLNLKEVCVSIAIGIFPLFYLQIHYWFAIVIPLLAFFWFMHFCTKRIGGYTGDCLGATQQFTEVMFYISIVIISSLQSHSIL